MPGSLKEGEGLPSRLAYCIENGETEPLMKPERLEPLRACSEVVTDILRECLTSQMKAQEPLRSYERF
jgi:hypothetical protein